MAINWKLRETVLRLLTAVYAEIGEEGFKGRYGRIAQLFGPDATYDAIKSFFAKEVARGAERLKQQRPDLCGTGRPLMNGSTRVYANPHPSLRGDDDGIQSVQQDEEEDDIRVTAAQQVQRYFSYPPRRPATIDLTTETARSPLQSPPPSSSSNNIPGQTTNGVFGAVSNSAPQQQPANTRQKITSPTRPPGVLPGRPYPPLPRQRPTQQVTGKRSYAATIDLDESVDENSAQSSQPRRQAVCTNLPFGYATRDNRYRCALCCSNFSSQQALDRHEATNKAHKNNLSNRFMVNRARSRLAEVNEALIDGASQSNAAQRPAQSRLSNWTHINGEYSTPITQTIHAESHQRTQRPALRPVSVSSTIDESESLHPPQVRSMLFSGPGARESVPAASSSAAHPAEQDEAFLLSGSTHATSRDKGKRRAETPPNISSSLVGATHGATDSSVDVDAEDDGSASNISSSAGRQLHCSLARAQGTTCPANEPPGSSPAIATATATNSNSNNNDNSTNSHQSREGDTTSDDSEAYRTAAAQLRASIGVLGERYIETHPEWLAQLMAAVQREVLGGVSSNATGNGSTGAAASSSSWSNGMQVPLPPPPPSIRGAYSVSASGVDLRGASVATATTATSSMLLDPAKNLFVGSRVGFGGSSRGGNGHAVGGGGGVRVQTGVRAREIVPGRSMKDKNAETVVIFVD